MVRVGGNLMTRTSAHAPAPRTTAPRRSRAAALAAALVVAAIAVAPTAAASHSENQCTDVEVLVVLNNPPASCSTPLTCQIGNAGADGHRWCIWDEIVTVVGGGVVEGRGAAGSCIGVGTCSSLPREVEVNEGETRWFSCSTGPLTTAVGVALLCNYVVP